MTNATLAGPARTPRFFLETAFRNARFVVRRVLPLLLLWQDRARQRRALAAMDRYRLADIGISPAAALREAGKPFWRI